MRQLLPLMLMACAAEAPPEETDTRSCDAGPERIGVVTTLRFARPDEQGHIVGFDLDQDATGFGGTGGCGVTDDVSPDGVSGVDSVFARLLPALELTEAQAVEGIVQDSINNGQILILWDLKGVDELADDTCATMQLLRGEGPPFVGGKGTLNPGQTFDVQAGSVVDGGEVSLHGGTFEASGFDFNVPFSFTGTALEFVLHDVHMRTTVNEDGTFTGMLGGAVWIDDIFEVATKNNVDPSIVDLLRSLIGPMADLAPDASGTCTALSLTLTFSGVPAFLYETPTVDTGL